MSDRPTYRPCCPNHGEPLEGCPFPLPARGEARCPISGCMFAYEADVDEEEIARDKFGKMVKKPKWKVEGDENGK